MSSDNTSDDVDEIADSNILAVPSKSFKFSCAKYGFMIFPAELSSSESSEFLTIIQHMVSNISSFTGCLEFVPKSNISLLLRLDVCHPRQPKYLFFLSLGAIPRVYTILHLPVAHDYITRQFANCDENFKFSVYPYSML